jgi:lysophospholipase L1-like esterase
MMRAVTYLSFALNVLTFVGFVAFWLQRVKIFRGILHAIESRAAISFFEAYPVEAGDVVFLGDSITAGGQWAEIFPNVTVKNRGISGDLTQDLLKRLGQVTIGKPRSIFLMIGTNDIGLGTPRDQTVRNYSNILDQIVQESPETRVYVQSILPREARYYEQVVALNATIAAMVETRGLDYADLFSAFLGDGGAIREELSSDNLHLNGQGYRLWGSLVELSVR